jgi:PhnB protein
MKVQPYLFFNGHCEEAIEFYKGALGAQVTMLMRFKDNPDRPPADTMSLSFDDKIMYADLRIGDAEFMASDGMDFGKPEFKGVSLSLDVTSESEAKRLFNALSQGGQVQMPIGKTFFSPCFGMVADKFGVSWMVIATQEG